MHPNFSYSHVDKNSQYKTVCDTNYKMFFLTINKGNFAQLITSDIAKQKDLGAGTTLTLKSLLCCFVDYWFCRRATKGVRLRRC